VDLRGRFATGRGMERGGTKRRERLTLRLQREKNEKSPPAFYSDVKKDIPMLRPRLETTMI